MRVAASLKRTVDTSDKGKDVCDGLFHVVFNTKAHVKREDAVAVLPTLATDVLTLHRHCIKSNPRGNLRTKAAEQLRKRTYRR